MSNPNPTIFFAGLGAMGHGMATHLLRSGFPTTGYDLQPLSMLKPVSEGGASANTPREAAKDAGFMIVTVANHQQATLLLFDPVTGVVEGLKGGATVIVCSTVAPAYIVEVSKRPREMGGEDVRLIDCPV